MTELRGEGIDPSHLHPDRLISPVAARQDDVIVREQLRALGLGRGAIAHRRRRGVLRALHDGAYLWGSAEPTTAGRARAAAAVCGAGARVTHAWAVALWQLRPAGDGPVDITVSGRRVRAAGIRGHESAPPAPADVRWIHGIPVSAPARALLEIAPHTAARELADLVEKAQVRRLLSRADIATAIKRAGSIAGVAALRALAEEQAFTRSRAERRLVALLRSARLPEPIFNAEAAGMEVDALWPRERVVMEFDSYAFHATRAAFERDRRRTATLSRARYVVLRTTWSELTDSSHALVARTAEALALNAPRQ